MCWIQGAVGMIATVDRSDIRVLVAIVLRTAGEGWCVDASYPVREWRDGWAG